MKTMRVVVWGLFIAFAVVARATSVVPPTFDQLVGTADAVVRGNVVAVRSELRAPQPGADPMPFTIVTVQVERSIVGDAGKTIDLVFLGGEVGGERLTVSGQPQLKVGDREILFVQGNGRQLSPLVAMAYGRYSLIEYEGREIVARDNGVPLTAEDEVSSPMGHAHEKVTAQAAMIRAALTAAAFEQKIAARAAVVRNQAQPSPAPAAGAAR
ncbi:hypothetical protein [Nibricoccus sp. IMCC34717]|uniref:hypothetical protein n=1 Tax=Nibricoccus sp. IMCC34717 TaxID=3034021 RepID=UPI00384E041A